MLLQFCPSVHSHKNLLDQLLLKASPSVLWFMFIYPFVLILCLYEGGIPVSLILIYNIRLLFVQDSDRNFGSGFRRCVSARWNQGQVALFGHANSDSRVNTGHGGDLQTPKHPGSRPFPAFWHIGVKIHPPPTTPDLPSLSSFVLFIDLSLVHKTQFCMKSYFHQNKSGDTSGSNAPRSPLNPYQKSEIFSFWNGQN